MLKSKMATIVGDVTGLHKRHHPLKINLILLSRSKAFHWRQNRFQILQIIMIKNSGEGFHPPHPLIHGWGMNLRVRPRVNPVKLIWIICFSHLLYSRGEKSWKGIIKIMMMMMIIIIINITVITMHFSFAKLQFAC